MIVLVIDKVIIDCNFLVLGNSQCHAVSSLIRVVNIDLVREKEIIV